MLRKFLASTVLVLLVLTAAACSGSEEDGEGSEATAAPTTEGQAEEPDDGAEPTMVISSGSETVSIGGGELPEGWPDTFPLPEGAELAGSASSPGNYVVWFSSGGSTQEDLKVFFDDELPANGWTIESELDFGDDAGSYSAYAISGNGYSGGVYVGEGAPGSEGFEGDFAFWVALTAE